MLGGGGTDLPPLSPISSWEGSGQQEPGDGSSSLPLAGLVPLQQARPSLGTIAGILVIFRRRRSKGNNNRKTVGCSFCLAKAGCLPSSGNGAKLEGLEVPHKDAGVPLSLLLSLGLLGLVVLGKFCVADPLLEASCFAQQA